VVCFVARKPELRNRLPAGFLPGFSQLKIVRFAAKSHGRREKSLGKCGLDKEMRRFPVKLHRPCGTRLWTACTRLILQQIKELVFY
jgi:hypothetical protein